MAATPRGPRAATAIPAARSSANPTTPTRPNSAATWSTEEWAAARSASDEGRPMDPLLAAILDEDGIPHEDHVSRCLTADLLADADLVLTFEFAQQLRILDAWPAHAARMLPRLLGAGPAAG